MRAWSLYLANFRKVYSPSPLVPPTKTATSPDGRLEAIRAFEALTRSSETMMRSCSRSVEVEEGIDKCKNAPVEVERYNNLLHSYIPTFSCTMTAWC